MAYHREIYEAVQKKLANLRLQKEIQAKKRKQIFYLKVPQAEKIELLLSKTAIKIAKAILNGGDIKNQLQNLKNENLKLQEELIKLQAQAKFPPHYFKIEYQCCNCSDTGYIDGKMCSCMKKLLRQEAYDRLNRLSPISLCSFDTFSLKYYPDNISEQKTKSPKKVMEKIFEYCKNYADQFSVHSSSLLFQGSTGLGKTHLSLAIAEKVINKGFGVIYGSTPNIVAKIEKERFSASKELISSDSENCLTDCDLLILDDLGTEFATSFSCATIYNIINSRITLGRSTIISTNLSTIELEQTYSNRLVSRIMGSTVRAEFIGNDIRQQKRIEKNIRIKNSY
ncbi:MAG: ATP-binding protein [Oscillospiraceae bacterium]|jgi:DNA replication protein DnaC|nr:ATP-binding protein [Oscillospiraceae bacterium]